MPWAIGTLLGCVVAAAALAGGPALAAAGLQAGVFDGLGVVSLTGDTGAPVLVSVKGRVVVVDAGGSLPADAAGIVGRLRGLVTEAAVDGKILSLTLAPGVVAKEIPLPRGRLAFSLEPAGAPVPPADSAPPSAPGQLAAARLPEGRPRESSRRPAPLPSARPANPPPPTAGTAPPPEPAAGPGAAAGHAALAVEPEPARARATAAPAPPPDRVRVTGGVARGVAELSFAWPSPVPAAVFRRGDVLWAAFGASPGTVEGLAAPAGGDLAGWVEPLAPRTTGGAQVFRFQLRRKTRVEVAQDGAVWRVRLVREGLLGGGDPAAAAPVGVARDVAGGAIRGAAPARALELEDPETGERLGVLLAMGGAGAPRHPAPVRLVDLELLPSAQGLAWRPLADGIAVTADRDGFALTRPGGLRLSGPGGGDVAVAAAGAAPGTDRLPVAGHDRPEAAPRDGGTEPAHRGAARAHAPALAASPMPPAPPTALIGLPTLAGTSPAERQRARLELAGRLPALGPAQRASGRLDQARLLLADGLGPEARGTLERALPDGLPPAALRAVERGRAAMLGAAAALEGRHDKALARLLEPALDGDPEVALWRAYAAARAGRHLLAAQEWARGGAILADYPDALQLKLGLEVAGHLAQHGAPRQAQPLLDLLRPLAAGDAAAKAQLQLLRGIVATRTGRPVIAEQTLATAAKGGDPGTRVQADFLLAVSRHEQGALDASAAAEALLAQRPNWRGHPWETRMLRRLGALRIQAGEALPGFATLLEAANRPGGGGGGGDAAEAAATAAELRDRLKDLLGSAGAGGGLGPVAAVALHGSHGDLLDGDPEAPALRRRLAAVAAAAGLAESSAALLAQAGGPPPSLGDGGPEAAAAAERGRMEAAARAGDWAGAARAAEALLARHPGDGPLPEDGAAALVWLAVARAEGGEPAEAALLAARHGARLPQDGPWRALLGLVASTVPEPTTAEEAPAVAGALADAVRRHLGELGFPPVPAVEKGG